MAVIQNFKEKIESDINIFSKSIFRIIDELENEIKNKNDIIEQKDMEIKELRNQIQNYQEKNKQLLNIISKLELENKKIVNKVKEVISNNTIIVASPEDAFKYPIDIIFKYLTAINWSRIMFEQIMLILDLSFDLKNWELVDFILVKTTDERLENFTKKEFEQFVRKIGIYLEKQNEINKFSFNGIYVFLDKIISLRWTELLKNFIFSFHKSIEEILIKITNNDEKDKYLFILLKLYFLLDFQELTKQLLFVIEKRNATNREINLKNTHFIELLYIATYFKKDIDMIDSNIVFYNVLQLDLPEIKCYFHYYDGLLDSQITINKIDEIKKIKGNCTFIDYDIKEKVINKMLSDLYSLTIKNKKLEENNKSESTLKFEKEEVNEVILIKKKKITCPFDNYNLIKRVSTLNYFSNKKKTIIENSIKIDLLFCPRCKKYFVNQLILEQISQFAPIKKFKIIPVKNNKPEINFKIQPKSTRKFMTNHKNEYNTNSNSIFLYENELNDVSDLRKLGYTTKLSREKRWEILTEKAIPTLGVYRVKQYIKWFIKMRERQVNKDYSYAIGEWKYDLERLNRCF